MQAVRQRGQLFCELNVAVFGSVLLPNVQSREKVFVRGCEIFLPGPAKLFCLALPGCSWARFANFFSLPCKSITSARWGEVGCRDAVRVRLCVFVAPSQSPRSLWILHEAMMTMNVLWRHDDCTRGRVVSGVRTVEGSTTIEQQQKFGQY